MPLKSRVRVLLALPDAAALSALKAYFSTRDDCVVAAVPGHADGLAEGLLGAIQLERPDVLVLRVHSEGGALAAVRQGFPQLTVVAAAARDAETAFQAARLGAVEMLHLPLEEEEMAAKLDRAIISALASASSTDRTPASGPPISSAETAEAFVDALVDPSATEFPNSFRTSGRMAEIREMIDKVATTSATVLIRGESGVGKEIVARMIFARSERAQRPFVKVNCAAIPNDLLESELFGFEAGAFTGAQRAKPGKFEMADGGTIFLDEIGEMHPMLQAKLLHVLQDGEFSRLGAKRDTAVDVRVLCATNKLLEQRVAEGAFREDLFYRINVVTLHIPPLRERPEEIPVLLDYFVRKYSSVYRRAAAPFDAQAVKFLCGYFWPGNIRELENLCKRYVIVGGAAQIVQELASRVKVGVARGEPNGLSSRPLPNGEASVEGDSPSLLEIGRKAAWHAERQAIEEMLVQTHWNRKEAARRLRVSYKALLNKIDQIEVEDGASKGHSGSR